MRREIFGRALLMAFWGVSALTGSLPGLLSNALGQSVAVAEEVASSGEDAAAGEEAATSADPPTAESPSGDDGKGTPSTDGKVAAEATEGSKKISAIVVSLGLSGTLSEAVASPGLFGDLQRNLRQTLDRLEQAAKDDDVSAVVLRIRNAAVGRGKLHEIRQAVQRLRRAGKQVVADLHFAMPADYLIAAACDRIIMPESGNLMLPGIRAEVVFYQGLFEKLGIRADMLQVGDYKGAAEPYTRKHMSDAFRQQYDLVIDDLYDQMVDMIATDRNLNREAVTQAIDQGLFTAEQARAAKLIDLVAYEDQSRRELGNSLSVDSLKIVRDYGRKKVDTDFSGMSGMFKFFELLSGSSSKSRSSKAEKIAIVYAVGPIMTGRSQSDLWGVQSVGSDTTVSALREAEEDERVAGIVLRIDSPGGSALASDLIWNQIRKCEKPVVASMGDIAASGGYYIAMGCDKILAEPGTLTGSIGVVGGKFALSGMMGKIGLTADVISRGKNSGLFSTLDQFSESERAAFRRSMESTYDQFTRKAAAGRGMDQARLQKLAGGRIWTGRQAQQKGLVDELGTLDDAIEVTRRLAQIPGNDDLDLIILPKPKSFLEQLIEGPDADVSSPRAVRSLLPLAGPEASRAWQTVEMMQQEPFLLWLPYQVNIR